MPLTARKTAIAEQAKETRSEAREMMQTYLGEDAERTGEGTTVNVAGMTLTPIWRESLLGVEFAGLVRNRVFREPPNAPEAMPVMLIPGFLTGDAQIATLASWLRRCGHRTHKSGIRLNVDCGEAAMCRLEDRLEAFVQREGERAALIGQSRGGTFARVLAVRRPELVRSVITLGSPHLAPLAVHPRATCPARRRSGCRAR